MLQNNFSSLVNGGWRIEPFNECSEVCRNETAGIVGIQQQYKYCDSPHPLGGDLCPCNSSNPLEKECNGLYSVIEKPCNEEPCQGLLIIYHLDILDIFFNFNQLCFDTCHKFPFFIFRSLHRC